MRSQIHETNSTIDHAAISAVAGRSLAMKREPAALDDLEELGIAALQAGHDTGNSIAAVRSRPLRARRVATKRRAAHSKRTPKGARRLSSPERCGSSSLIASST